MNKRRLLSLREAAARLGMTYITVWRMAKRNDLPGAVELRSSKRAIWRVDSDYLERWIAENRSESSLKEPIPDKEDAQDDSPQA